MKKNKELKKCYRQLALLHLEFMQTDGLQTRWGLYQNLIQQFQDLFNIMSSLRIKINGLTPLWEGEKQSLDECKAAYNAANEQYLSLLEKANLHVTSLPRWKQLHEAAVNAISVAEFAETKSESALMDRHRAKSVIESDTVFKSLSVRRYGTIHHKGFFLYRWFEAIAAYFISFRARKDSLDLYHELADHLEEHVKEKKQLAEAARNALAEFERREGESPELLAAEERSNKAKEQLDMVQISFNKIDAEYSELKRKLREYKFGEQDVSSHLLDEMVKILKSKNITKLRDLSAQTNHHESELIIDQIEKLLAMD